MFIKGRAIEYSIEHVLCRAIYRCNKVDNITGMSKRFHTKSTILVVVALTFCQRFPKGKLAWDGISLGFRLGNIFRLHCKILPEVNV